MKTANSCPVIGLTGGIASGKGTAAQMFAAKGIMTVDADDVSRRVSHEDSEVTAKIIKYFGNSIVAEEGKVNRAALREIVFNDVKALKWLEGLLHPLIREELVQQLAKCAKCAKHAKRDASSCHSCPYCLLVSPLLLETSQHQLCDKIIVMDINQETQIKRACSRDNMDEKLAEQIINSQMPQQEKRNKADYLLDNNQDKQYLAAQVDILHQKLLKL